MDRIKSKSLEALFFINIRKIRRPEALPHQAKELQKKNAKLLYKTNERVAGNSNFFAPTITRKKMDYFYSSQIVKSRTHQTTQ